MIKYHNIKSRFLNIDKLRHWETDKALEEILCEVLYLRRKLWVRLLVRPSRLLLLILQLKWPAGCVCRVFPVGDEQYSLHFYFSPSQRIHGSVSNRLSGSLCWDNDGEQRGQYFHVRKIRYAAEGQINVQIWFWLGRRAFVRQWNICKETTFYSQTFFSDGEETAFIESS